MNNIAIFASGTGSNFEAIHKAIIDHKLQANLCVVICDQPQALVVQKANKRNIPVFSFQVKDYKNKKEYETNIVQILQQYHIDLIVLAGYMRLIGPTILKQYPRRIINIHPSLLPQFKGLDAVGQAMNAGVTTTGVTIHYVDEGMDTGEIIDQQSLDISLCDTREEIEFHIHEIEHKLYPKVIQKVLEELQ